VCFKSPKNCEAEVFNLHSSFDNRISESRDDEAVPRTKTLSSGTKFESRLGLRVPVFYLSELGKR
jgi:hypothetical protein